MGFGWAQGGLLGVGVFFTLSGYLITDILLGQWTSAGRLRLGDFWLRRAAAAAGAVRDAGRGGGVGERVRPGGTARVPRGRRGVRAVREQLVVHRAAGLLLRAVRAPDRGSGGGPRRLGGEARWWLAGATLVLAAGSAAAMAVLYRPGLDPTRVYEGTDTRAFGLLTGSAVAVLWPTRRAAPLPRRVRWLLDPAGVAGLAVVGLLVWRTTQYSVFMFRGGLEVLSVATALAVAAVAVPGSLLGRALGWRPLRWLGVRSYGDLPVALSGDRAGHGLQRRRG